MEKFESAEIKYLKMVSLLKELCSIKRGKTYLNEYCITLTQFDTSIQAVLLYVALLNGFLEDDEKHFIKSITINGKLMDKLNVVGKRRLFSKWQMITWDNLNDITIDHNRLMDVLKETVTFESIDFAEALAPLDKDISTKSYIDEISSLIPSLLKAVCIAENESIEKEKLYENINKGVEFYDNTIRLHWISCLQR